MTSNAKASGRVVTFYSYKGGTGRTMLLANVAWILASAGKRVLVIDWDMEAPGLHLYLHPFLTDPQHSDTDGLIDLVEDYCDTVVSEEPKADPGKKHKPADWLAAATDITAFSTAINWNFPAGGSLVFMPSGRQNIGYSMRVNTFGWQHFYEELDGGHFFEHLKKRLRNEYDYILIDSRTGVSDTSGICTIQMPDRLVVCFTASEQNIRGGAAVAKEAKNYWARLDEQRASQMSPPIPGGRRIFPILTRVETSEKNKLEAARQRVSEMFDPIIADITTSRPEDYWKRAQAIYWPWYAFEEVLAVFGDKSAYEGSLLAACETVTQLITDGEVTAAVPPQPAERERALAAYERRRADQPADAVMLISSHDWAEAMWPLEELRRTSGLRIDARDMGEWTARGEVEAATQSGPPLIVAAGSGATRLATPEPWAVVDRARSRGARLHVLVLPGVPANERLPEALEILPATDLRGATDLGEALLPLEFALKQRRGVSPDDARLVIMRRKRRLIVQAREWESKRRNEDYLLQGSQLDEVLDWIRDNPLESETLARDFIEASKVRRDKSETAARLQQAEEAATAAAARLETAEAEAARAKERLSFAERAQGGIETLAEEARRQLAEAHYRLAEAHKRSGRLRLVTASLVVLIILAVTGVTFLDQALRAQLSLEQALLDVARRDIGRLQKMLQDCGADRLTLLDRLNFVGIERAAHKEQVSPVVAIDMPFAVTPNVC